MDTRNEKGLSQTLSLVGISTHTLEFGLQSIKLLLPNLEVFDDLLLRFLSVVHLPGSMRDMSLDRDEFRFLQDVTVSDRRIG